MFKKILIANRGEIACRIMLTARKLGIQAALIYSEADADSLAVKLSDEAYLVGPSPAKESYLCADKIIEFSYKNKADAIHPGYGFLSENAEFAKKCEEKGIAFIGPSAEAMAAMSSKSSAKALAQKINIPVVPGYSGSHQTAEFLIKEAEKIGFPVLIKAVNGGGGKGMRVVENTEEFEFALASAKREALSSFGDDQVLLEKYLEKPRHIEIQIFADKQGNVVHLFDRDCSIQRRHQKILEEAPAPFISSKTRSAMAEAAIKMARAIHYVGAGTVEFLLAQNECFYFMEMNTRLQVEHPVTEMITGLDLVEWQLRVASGEPLPLTQQTINEKGHAIEVRLCSEDPTRDFLPSTGTIQKLVLPIQNFVRLDMGVTEKSVVTPFYDSMLGKLIVWGNTREEAILRLRSALSETKIEGVKNNIDFLIDIVGDEIFEHQASNTHFLTEKEARLSKDNLLWESKQGWRLNLPASTVLMHDDEFVEYTKVSETNDHLTAPMPGKVIALLVALGSKVKKGTKLALLEAMKIEHALCAPSNGFVKKWYCEIGEVVEEGKTLLDFEETE